MIKFRNKQIVKMLWGKKKSDEFSIINDKYLYEYDITFNIRFPYKEVQYGYNFRDVTITSNDLGIIYPNNLNHNNESLIRFEERDTYLHTNFFSLVCSKLIKYDIKPEVKFLKIYTNQELTINNMFNIISNNSNDYELTDITITKLEKGVVI